jgi:hypothetical protein
MAFGQKTGRAGLHLLEEQARVQREEVETKRLANEQKRFELQAQKEQKARLRVMSIFDKTGQNLEMTLGILSHDSNAQRDFEMATGTPVSTILGGVESEGAQASMPFSAQDILSGQQPVGPGENFVTEGPGTFNPLMSPTEMALTRGQQGAATTPGLGIASLLKSLNIDTADLIRGLGTQQLSKRPADQPADFSSLSQPEIAALSHAEAIPGQNTLEASRTSRYGTDIQAETALAAQALEKLIVIGNASPELNRDWIERRINAPILSAREARAGNSNILTPAESNVITTNMEDVATIDETLMAALDKSQEIFTFGETIDSPLVPKPGVTNLPKTIGTGTSWATALQRRDVRVKAGRQMELANPNWGEFHDYIAVTEDGQFIPSIAAELDPTIKVKRDAAGKMILVDDPRGLNKDRTSYKKLGVDGRPFTAPDVHIWRRQDLMAPRPAAAPETTTAPSALSPDVTKNLGILGIKPGG